MITGEHGLVTSRRSMGVENAAERSFAANTVEDSMLRTASSVPPVSFGSKTRLAAQTGKPISIPVTCGLLVPFDAIAIVACSALAFAVWLADTPYARWQTYSVVTLFGALVAVNVFRIAGLYQFSVLTRPRLSWKRAIVAWTAVAVILLAVSFFTKTSGGYSRGWSALWFASVAAIVLVSRIAFYRKTRKWIDEGRLYRNVAIVGAGQTGQRLVRQLRDNPEAGVRVVGLFDDRLQRTPSPRADYSVQGNLETLIEYIRNWPVDTVIVAVPWSAEWRIAKIVAKLRVVPVDIRLCPGPAAFHLKAPGFCHFGQIPMLKLLDRPLSDWRSAIKELEDRALAALILAMIAPLMLAIAAAIKIDSPGPVFFRQKRYGFNDQLIEVLKFRSMYVDYEDANADQLTRRNDPRITPLGAILRKWSFDELPQFINVLRGEMSIVGPRPHAIAAKAAGIRYGDAVPDYGARHRMKPGITGWAQINGWRGDTETLEQIEKRVEHDLYYIEHWSLWFDLKIILLTVVRGFAGQNAY